MADRLKASCIILAAGRSSRMGFWKVEALTRGGQSFLERAIDLAQGCCEDLIVVGGYRMEDLRKRVSPGVRLVENPHYNRGLLSSLQRGLQECNGYAFILPVDMPLITPAVFFKLYENRHHSSLIRPVWRGQPGHPVLIPPSLKETILAKQGRTLGSLIPLREQFLIPWTEEIFFDVDYPEAYEDYLARQDFPFNLG